MPVKIVEDQHEEHTVQKVVLELDDKTSVTTHLHGGTVTSLILNGKELIFVSEKAIFNNTKAIRGGIPICFPQFGPWPLGPQHGFARISAWEKLEEADEESVSTVNFDKSVNYEAVSFLLSENEKTKEMWNCTFNLILTLVLTHNSLHMYLKVVNTDNKNWDFTALLHTYFRTASTISDVKVSGLTGLKFIDKLQNCSELIEDRAEVFIDQACDRVYQDTSERHVISLGNSENVNVLKHNLADTVVWNPWIAGAKSMGDFGDDEYTNMICVEAGAVSKKIELRAGESWIGSQTISL